MEQVASLATPEHNAFSSELSADEAVRQLQWCSEDAGVSREGMF